MAETGGSAAAETGGSAATSQGRGVAGQRRRARLAVTATGAAVVAVAGLVVAVMLLQGEEVALEAHAPATTPPTAPPPTSPPPDTPPAEPTPPAEEPEVAERPVPAVVTEDDDGTTFLMQPGAHTALRLSNDWRWDPPAVRGDAVMLAEVAYFADPGYVEWHVEAVAPGAVEIVVQGAPNCADEAACPPRSVSLSLLVER